MPTEPKILPCPFCGAGGRVRSARAAEDCMDTWVECTMCFAKTDPVEAPYAEPLQAIRTWNRRPESEGPGVGMSEPTDKRAVTYEADLDAVVAYYATGFEGVTVHHVDYLLDSHKRRVSMRLTVSDDEEGGSDDDQQEPGVSAVSPPTEAPARAAGESGPDQAETPAPGSSIPQER